jgi:hypothetical protein
VNAAIDDLNVNTRNVFVIAGIEIAAKIITIATTSNNSISVNLIFFRGPAFLTGMLRVGLFGPKVLVSVSL